MIIVLTWYARTQSGLSLVRLAELTGVSKTTLNDIENGKVSPTLEQLETIAHATGRKVADLYDEK